MKPFPGSAVSLDSMGIDVMTALVHADRARLEGYRLTADEHNLVVWPELPASDPDVNFPIDYAWMNIQQRNAAAVGRELELFEGKRVDVIGTECRGEVEEFRTFRVHTDCWVLFELQSNPLEIQVFKDVLERAGRFKVFRYYDSEPRRRVAPESES